MIEFVIIALLGSVVAGLWDLKTTEVPDEVPALMIVSGIFLWYVNGAVTGDFSGLALSLLSGSVLLAFGLLLYKRGQWGGADAWILAAIGYLLPIYGDAFFIADYIMNFLVVSAAYMIIYSLALGAMNPGIFRHYPSEFRARWKSMLLILLVFAAPVLVLGYYAGFTNMAPVFSSFSLIVLLIIFWVYAKVIEKYAFRKEIPASKLRVGDVLEDMVWRGLTAEEVMHIRKQKKHVIIKEGVRFVPAFAITLVVTLLFGNVLMMLF